MRVELGKQFVTISDLNRFMNASDFRENIVPNEKQDNKAKEKPPEATQPT